MSLPWFLVTCGSVLLFCGDVGGVGPPVVIVPKPKSTFRFYCDDALIYKPYLKYYKGRREAEKTGRAVRTLGPGFHMDFAKSGMENSYICVNGMAWLYYSVTTKIATVYSTPRLHSFVHHCFMANGVPGPGPHEQFKRLLAVLLVGNRKDYRRPSAQLFPAPYKNATSGEKEYNATSVFVIGDDTECVLTKGNPPVEFRVRNDNDAGSTPTTTNNTTPTKIHFCKLSYQNLLGNLINTTNPRAKDLLKNDAPISLKGCWTPGNYTADFETYAGNQANFYNDILNSTSTTRWGKLYHDLINMTAYLMSKGVDATNAVITNPCNATPDVCTEAKIKEDLKTSMNATLPTPDEKKKNLLEIKLPIMLRNWASRLFIATETMTNELTNVAKAYDEAKTAINASVALKEKIEAPGNGTLQLYLDAKKAAEDAYAQTGAKNQTLEDALKITLDALEMARRDMVVSMHTAQLKLSIAETANQTITALLMKGAVAKVFAEYISIYKRAAAGGNIPLEVKNASPLPFSDTLTISKAATPADELVIDTVSGDKTMFEIDKDSKKTCGALPETKDACSSATPDRYRACTLLRSKLATTPTGQGDWLGDDGWRDEVLDLVGEIFTHMTPRGTISNVHGYYMSVRGIIKGYLTDYINGTLQVQQNSTGPGGSTTVAPAGRRKRGVKDDKDSFEEFSRKMRQDTIAAELPREARPGRQAAPAPAPPPATPPGSPPAATSASGGPAVILLNPKRSFYIQILKALRDCRDKKFVLKFDMGNPDAQLVLLKKQGKTGVRHLLVEENFEQADDEYAFNWAIDQMWFVFTSVLGVCMPAYEMSIPLISIKFYTHYTEDFLYPLAREWVNSRDNGVLRLICGEWFKSKWPKRIMEASFVHSGDLKYRPPRKLYVNDLTEGNFFTEGPLKGTAGIYAV